MGWWGLWCWWEGDFWVYHATLARPLILHPGVERKLSPRGEHHALGALLAPVLAAAREHGGSPKAVLEARLCRVLYLFSSLGPVDASSASSGEALGVILFFLPLCVISPGFVRRRRNSTATLDWVVLSPGKDVLGPGWEEDGKAATFL